MNPIQRIDGATSRHVLPGAASTEAGAADSNHPFAAAMRSAVSAAHTPAAGSNRSIRSSSATSVASNRQPASSPSHSAASPDGDNNSVSTHANPEGKPRRKAANDDEKNASSSSGMSSQDSVQEGDISVGIQGQVTPPVPTEECVVRSRSVGTSNRNIGSTKQSASLPVESARKTVPSGKSADLGATMGAAVSPGVVGNATVIVTNTSVAKVFGSNVVGIRAQGDGTSGNDAIQQDKDATNQHQSAQNIEAARNVSGGWIFSGQEIAAHPSVDQGHAFQGVAGASGNDGKAVEDSASAVRPASTSGTHPDIGSDSRTAGGQIPAASIASTANNSANGSVDSSADASPSSVSTTGAQSMDGKNGSPVSGGSAPAMHSNNSSGNSNSPAGAITQNLATGKANDGALVSSSMPSGAGISHENTANPKIGSPGILSVANHANVTGNLAVLNANAAATRGTSSDAFTALDSGPAVGRGILLHAAPHQVAVGVTDPSLGWVEVRAERIGGQIAAALSTGSAASHAALTSILPAMATYLQEHHAGVQQIHVETGLTRGGQPGTGSQGQSSPQGNGRAGTENMTVANPGSHTWTAISMSGESLSAVRGTNLRIEGHHFSIHA